MGNPLTNLLKIGFFACNKNPARFLEDASFIYRCQNPALALRAAGHDVTLNHISHVHRGDRFDLAIVHRPRYHWRFGRWLSRLNKQANRLLADIDDLIMHEDYAYTSPAVLNAILPEAKVRKEFQANHRALSQFDRFSVSTQPLVERMNQHFPGATVMWQPNCPHLSWQAFEPTTPSETTHEKAHEKALETLNKQPHRLTYFPGTRSHERDFQQIESVISEFLYQHRDIQLEITGHLKTQIKVRPEQLIRIEKQPFAAYVQRVQQSWVNLSPLEATTFNACKSALKVIEAGYWNTPTLSSPTADAERFNGTTALICAHPEDWLNYLRALTEPQFYRQHSHNLRAKTLAAADIHQIAQKLVDCALQ